LSIIQNLSPRDNILLAEFNSELKVLSELTGDRQKIEKGLRKINQGDGTSFYEALSTIYQKHVSAIKGRKALVIFTDAVDTTSRKSNYAKSLLEAEKWDLPVYPIYFDTLATASKAMKTSIIGIIGNQGGKTISVPGASVEDYNLGKQYLNDLVRLSGGWAFAVKSGTDEQKNVAAFIAKELQNKYYLKIPPPGQGGNQLRRQIKVRVNRPNLLVKSRGSYLPGNR
jgi:VWFA-related protein